MCHCFRNEVVKESILRSNLIYIEYATDKTSPIKTIEYFTIFSLDVKVTRNTTKIVQKQNNLIASFSITRLENEKKKT